MQSVRRLFSGRSSLTSGAKAFELDNFTWESSMFDSLVLQERTDTGSHGLHLNLPVSNNQ